MHKWCTEFADELNNRGLNYKEVTKQAFDLEWNMDMVKRVFWQSLGKAKCGKVHTSEWNRSDFKAVQVEIEHILSDPETKLGQAGIVMPFPSQALLDDNTIDNG